MPGASPSVAGVNGGALRFIPWHMAATGLAASNPYRPRGFHERIYQRQQQHLARPGAPRPRPSPPGRRPSSSSSTSTADPLASLTQDGTTAGATTPATTSTASDSTASSGLQKFATELQSILISAQSGQANASNTTATDPATASDPAGATDPTASPNPAGRAVRHLADRLQDLLSSVNGSGTTGTASTSTASTSNAATNTTSRTAQPDSLQSVLDRLQTTLQQTLQSYGTAAAATSTTSLTA